MLPELGWGKLLSRELPRAVFEAVFGAYVDRTEPAFGFHHVTAPDGGEADIYFGGGSVMINHFSPGDVLDLVVEFARQADAVVVRAGADVEAVLAAS